MIATKIGQSDPDLENYKKKKIESDFSNLNYILLILEVLFKIIIYKLSFRAVESHLGGRHAG